MKWLIKCFTRKKDKKEKKKDEIEKELPICDYDGMGNFSRMGKP